MNKFIFEKNMADVEPMEMDDEPPVAPRKKRVKLSPRQKRMAERKKRAIKDIKQGQKLRVKSKDIMKKGNEKYAETKKLSSDTLGDGIRTSIRGWGQRALSTFMENDTQTLEEKKNMFSKFNDKAKERMSSKLSKKDKAKGKAYSKKLKAGKKGKKTVSEALMEHSMQISGAAIPIVDAVMNAEPATTQDMIKDILSSKLSIALDAYKAELSNDVFNEPSEFDDEDYEDGLEDEGVVSEWVDGPEDDEEEFEDDEEEFDDIIFDDEEYVEDEEAELQEKINVRDTLNKVGNFVMGNQLGQPQIDDVKGMGRYIRHLATRPKK